MKYSVIIPSYNSEATIMRCLQAVTQQHFDEPYEVIVVDSSNDATPEMIRQYFPQVKLIHFDTQTDAGTARNTGIQYAQGEIICLIDSDCIADPNWLRTIDEAHKNDYAAVGGSILNGNPESFVGWTGYFAEFREFFPFHPKQFMTNIPTCNISYKRRVFDRYGMFPDDFYPQEDLVFNQRLYQHGDTILFDPTIKVAHINKTSTRHFVVHQYRIGRITSAVLRCFPDLHGSFIARSRILTILAAPLLPCVKFLNTLRVAALSRAYRRYFLLTSPLLFIGLLVWAAGFVRGVFLPRAISITCHSSLNVSGHEGRRS